LDSDQLKTFLAIHRTNSFSLAAEALARSQPAISRRIALLEAELKAPLFERTGSSFVLSQAGRVLLPYAERVAAALQDANDAVDALHIPGGGPVSLAAVGTLASTNLTAILKRFAKRWPKSTLALRTATSDEVSDLVRRGEAAVGLRYHDDPAPDLACSFIAPEKLTVVCTTRHRLAGKTVPRLTDLKSETWFVFSAAPRDVSMPVIRAQFIVRGVDRFASTPVDSLTAQKRLVEAGYGIALLPESAVAEERAAKTLATIRVRDLDAANPIFAVTRKGGYLSEAAKSLTAMLKTEWKVAEKRISSRT
jgi:DNA-binding transcriptional LysR family regulator